jgi:hypothetical protein
MKNLIYERKVEVHPDLIRHPVDVVSTSVTVVRRERMCIEAEGGYSEHVLQQQKIIYNR